MYRAPTVTLRALDIVLSPQCRGTIHRAPRLAQPSLLSHS